MLTNPHVNYYYGKRRDNTNLLLARANELRVKLLSVDPSQLRINTGTNFNVINQKSGFFLFEFWDRRIVVTYPDFQMTDQDTNESLNIANQMLLLYYFVTADGTQNTGRWISFSDLPDGRFYNQAFQGYTGNDMVKRFKQDITEFEKVSQKLGGESYPFGGTAFRFKMLPHVPLLVVAWLGDEDFPPTFQVLYDSSVSHYLPTDTCAIAGSMLTRKIINTS